MAAVMLNSVVGSKYSIIQFQYLTDYSFSFVSALVGVARPLSHNPTYTANFYPDIFKDMPEEKNLLHFDKQMHILKIKKNKK